ncbi:MAG: YdcF family protein [Mangrovimonas sp.]|nr:YdcF family protein [Mangrovimonas sp.]MCB0434244.1 YdcF family protein [Mangrovimonas sp.]MCB0436235.1 YdcF family protein [Mangrovimonas sp.]MCB0470423.1 YdcF family protein [Flavobacteriaceae bacterium]
MRNIVVNRLLRALVVCLVFVFTSNWYIIHFSRGKLYSSTQELPKNKVGLVLGTVKYLSNGNLNYYYKYRIDATLELYNSGKIDFIIVSGDNGRKDYDEPSQFKKDLIAKGIPETKIFLDYAGFRTLDSVVRAKEIFGQESITIISQEFHNERAVFLAKNHGLKAVGYNAKDVTAYNGFKTNLREYFAKTKAVIDVLLNVSPKYLGDKIEIE